MNAPLPAAVDWPLAVHQALTRLGFGVVGYVPDAGHKRLIELCHGDARLRTVVLSTEEEGIGLATGAWLGGAKTALLMQSSGVGNIVNALGMVRECRIPLLMIVTMRGEWAEFNAWQNPMGQATEAALRLMGVMTWRADDPGDVVPLLHGAATMAFNGDAACALLLGQRLIGAKQWK